MPVPAPETTQTWPSSRSGAKICEGPQPSRGRSPSRKRATTLGRHRHADPRRRDPARRAPARGARGTRPSSSSRSTAAGPRLPREVLRVGGRRPAGGSRRWASAATKVLDVPVPAFLVRHPTAGPILIDTGLHPSRRQRSRATTWAVGRASYFELERGRGRRLAAARQGPRPARHRGRGHDPPALRPRLGDLGVPGRDLRPQRARSGGGDDRLAAPDARLPPRRTTTTPSTTAPSTSTADSSTPTAPSAAPSTCFGDGSVRLVFTPGPHARPHVGVLRLPRRDFVVAADVAYTWRQLEGGPSPSRPATATTGGARCRSSRLPPRGLPVRDRGPRPRPGVLGEARRDVRGVAARLRAPGCWRLGRRRQEPSRERA